MVDSNDLYPVLLVLSQEKFITIWYTDNVDGFVTDEEGRILIFRTLDDAAAYLAEIGFDLKHKEVVEYDVDSLEAWTIDTDNPHVDCAQLLDFWNLFIDVFAATGKMDEGWADSGEPFCLSYEKLFYGNNLPGVTPEGEEYVPAWSEEELKHIRATMSAGIAMLRKQIDMAG